MTLGNGIELTWLGHATFHVKTPGGKTFVIDPWVQNNPSCPDSWKNLDQGVDGLLCTHGHFDHIGDAVEIAKQHSPEITIGIWELCHWLESKGVTGCSAMNKGGTQPFLDCKVTMVHAVHSCGILDEGKIVYGGEACGYVIEFDDGYRIYHAGDTGVFSDMALIGELYSPDLALLPVGDHFTMGIKEAHKAIELLDVKKIVPMHFGTFPLLTGTPQALCDAVQDLLGVEVATLEPGQTLR